MRYAAFLRGMNVGGHRITNAELCAHIEALGFRDVVAFLASGNVVLDAGQKKDVAGRIQRGLHEALGYDVPTILRTADQVREIAAREMFDEEVVAASGKEQIWILADALRSSARAGIDALAAEGDLVRAVGREIHWLPPGSVLDSQDTMNSIGRLAGLATGRTKNTIVRLAKKHFPR